ncbi:MAG: dihydrodipicolinate synthase family protein, partial [Anaerolineae bacterium]|nr:dihydrodipicolinate synthase family protein [Anaerolineae bacterium]
AQHSNIVGIKDSSGDLSLTMAYLQQTDPGFSVLLGRDTLIYGGLLHGAKGSITATANVAPGLVVEIYEAYMAGDLERSLAAQHRLAPLRYAFSLGTFPAVVKIALNMVGIDAGPAREPVGTLSEGNMTRLKRIINDLD